MEVSCPLKSLWTVTTTPASRSDRDVMHPCFPIQLVIGRTVCTDMEWIVFRSFAETVLIAGANQPMVIVACVCWYLSPGPHVHCARRCQGHDADSAVVSDKRRRQHHTRCGRPHVQLGHFAQAVHHKRSRAIPGRNTFGRMSNICVSRSNSNSGYCNKTLVA